MPLTFNPETVPFSRYGSYLALNTVPNAVLLRTIHGGTLMDTPVDKKAFTMELPVNGRARRMHAAGTPEKLTVTAGKARAEFCFSAADTVRFRVTGGVLRLRMPAAYKPLVMPDDGNWVVNSFGNRRQFYLKALKGSICMDAPWKGTGAGSKNWQDYACGDVTVVFAPAPGRNSCEGSVEMFKESWTNAVDGRTFAACVRDSKAAFNTWCAGLPGVPARYGRGARLAAYINWSCTVAPDGNFRRPAVLMSKNWMNAVWSWDHAFNAMGILRTDPALAWDQLMLPFDSQGAGGMLPDSMTDTSLLWNFTKPPVHGWALGWMMRRSRAVNRKRLEEIYAPLGKWTDWWMTFRDGNRDGLPGYNHGNDSGWDNATLFMSGPPLTAPDLAAFLTLQMDVLAEIAVKLGKKRDAGRWTKRADALYALMMEKLWDGERFIAISPRGATPADADSLISFVPLVLGTRLEPAVRNKLIAGLQAPGRFMGPAGLASEAMSSPYYTPDGYWQGPVWAPSNMLIIDGLARAGETALAGEIARRFCANAAKNGMAENYDARTGAALCDKAYTWTSSVYLVLAAEYV